MPLEVDMKRLLILSVVLFPVLLAAPPTGLACDCFTLPIEDAFCRSTSVFVGTVISVDPPFPGGDFRILDGKQRIYRFSVTERFRRPATTAVEITDTGTDCDAHFDVGQQYLVYGSGRSDGFVEKHHFERLVVFGCTRTNLLKLADEDLRYLRQAVTRYDSGCLFGKIERHTWRKDYSFGDAKVTLTNRKDQFEATSGSPSGTFRFLNLSPGEYELSVDGLPKGLFVRSRSVVINAGGSVELEVRTEGKPSP